ncbi:MAG: DUF4924 family protein [Rikenellaceae bacterium]
MDISRSLRSENIAEYILYLWQLEDLLRGLQFSPEAVYSQFVQPRADLSSDDQEALLRWYCEYGDLLCGEGKRERGHLSHTLHLIEELQGFHLRLLDLPVGARYKILWGNLIEVLGDLRGREGFDDSGIGDIELCFRALYGGMLMRMKGQTSSMVDVLEYISPAIAELCRVYRMVERGEVDLFGGAD